VTALSIGSQNLTHHNVSHTHVRKIIFFEPIYFYVFWCYVLWCLHFVTFSLCSATFWNNTKRLLKLYVLWHLRFENFWYWNVDLMYIYVRWRYVMWRLHYLTLRYAETPIYPLVATSVKVCYTLYRPLVYPSCNSRTPSWWGRLGRPWFPLSPCVDPWFIPPPTAVPPAGEAD
jgi:hypothetical protein